MSNYAWVLEVRPGYEDEYKKRHDEIWPEMVQMLSDAGLRNYNIFRHGLTLFGYFETDDLRLILGGSMLHHDDLRLIRLDVTS